MAAFPSRDHDAFMTHWAKLRREPSNIIRTIVCDGQVAGNIGSGIAEDRQLIGYWIGREFWGRGVATAAFVAEVKERPLQPSWPSTTSAPSGFWRNANSSRPPSTIPASPAKTGSTRSSTCSRAEEYDRRSRGGWRWLPGNCSPKRKGVWGKTWFPPTKHISYSISKGEIRQPL